MLVIRILAACGLVVIGLGTGSAQDYPSKPIRIITTAAGGGGDFTARQIAQAISGPLGQPVLVDNRGSGVIAADTVVKSPPDGYTLTLNGTSLWIFPLLQKAPYDVVKDLAPISLLVREIQVLVVHPSLPVKSVKELIALAKSKPGQLNYASTITGGTIHLAVELFKSMAGVDIARIPYKGSAPALIGIVGGEAQMTITDVGSVAPHVKSGKLRALAVTSAEPSVLAPGLPTVATSGLPGYESVSMTGILAPARTPGPVINRLNQEIVRALNLPEVKERFLTAGIETVGSSPEQFTALIKSDMARMGKIIADAGIKVD